MFKNQRHNEILEILKNEKFAAVSELSKRLYASQPTIRRDLNLLEKQGYIRRSHGGAVLADEKNNLPISFRNATHLPEKQRICRVAASLVTADSFLFTDASTTALHLADFLPTKANIRVLTNGLLSAKAFSDKGIQVYSTGGRLLPDSLAFVGDVAAAAVARYHADIMFFSSSSLDSTGVVSDYSEEETSLRLCMAKHTRVKVFLCDAAKFGTTSSFCLFPLKEVDYAVTAAPLDADVAKQNHLCLCASEGAFLYRHTN